jgi:hypothetical protein
MNYEKIVIGLGMNYEKIDVCKKNACCSERSKRTTSNVCIVVGPATKYILIFLLEHGQMFRHLSKGKKGKKGDDSPSSKSQSDTLSSLFQVMVSFNFHLCLFSII